MRKWVLDHALRIGMALKLIDGTLELAGAILIAAGPGHLNHWVRVVTAHELSEDPTDFVANRLRLLAAAITSDARWFAFFYLLVHGVVKVVLASAVLKGRMWAYPWAIGVFGLSAVYTGYRAAAFSIPALWLLALLDLAIVALLWRERRSLLVVASRH
jgi:uncharacterized membrane protein